MLHRFLIVFLFFIGLGCSLTFGQRYDNPGFNKVTIYYEDGSVFIGQIVETVGNTVRLRLATRDTLTLHLSGIRDMINSIDLFTYTKSRYHFKKGHFVNLSGSLQLISPQSTYLGQLDLTAGRRVTERLIFGVGVGIMYSESFLSGTWIDHESYTLFGFSRGYLTDRGIRIFLEGRVGGALPNPNSWDPHTGGLLVQPGIGFHFPSRNKFKWIMGINQVIYNTSGTSRSQDWNTNLPITSEYNMWYNRTVFKLGIEFN